MEVISRNPQTLRPSAVELLPNEVFVSAIFDTYLDAGYGVIDAAQDALYAFYCQFPAAETDPETTPINWPFFAWLCGNPENHPGGYWNFDIMNQAPKWGTNLLVKMCEDRFEADHDGTNYPTGS